MDDKVTLGDDVLCCVDVGFGGTCGETDVGVEGGDDGWLAKGGEVDVVIGGAEGTADVLGVYPTTKGLPSAPGIQISNLP